MKAPAFRARLPRAPGEATELRIEIQESKIALHVMDQRGELRATRRLSTEEASSLAGLLIAMSEQIDGALSVDTTFQNSLRSARAQGEKFFTARFPGLHKKENGVA